MSNEELAELAKQGQQGSISELWEQTKLLLFKLAQGYYMKFQPRFIHCGVTLEDLEQECFLVLLRMVKAYDSEKGYKFTSYAEYQFRAHLRSLLKMGETLAEEPLNSCDYLDRTVGEESETTVGELTKDKASELAFDSLEEEIFQSELKSALTEAMNTALNDEQRAVIEERFYNGRTLAETGEIVGLNPNGVRDRERKALQKLRTYNIVTKKLESFKEEMLTVKAYRGTGLNSFRNRQESSTERAAEWLIRIEQERERLLASYRANFGESAEDI